MLGKVVVGDPTEEIDTGGDVLFLQGGFDRLFQWPVTANEHAMVLLIIEDGREGPGEVLMPFPAQPADVADEGRPIEQRDGNGESVEIEEVTVSDEDFVTVIFILGFHVIIRVN